jgi:hypothetical protein
MSLTTVAKVRLADDTSNTGKYLSFRKRSVGGTDVHAQLVVLEEERIITNRGIVSTFVTPGRAAAAQTIFTIENATGTGVLVGVSSIRVGMDATAVLTSRAISFTVGRGTAPSDGTSLTKQTIDNSAFSSDANVLVIGDASADDTSSGTGLSYTGTTILRKVRGMRLHTLVGQSFSEIELVAGSPFVLNENQCLGVNISAAAAGDNPTTNSYWVSVLWEEYTIPSLS